MEAIRTAYRLARRPLLAAALLLLAALVAMQVTGEVAWTPADFVFAGVLVLGTGLLYELAARRTASTACRLAVGVALAAGFLLVWVVAAVGVLGAAGDPADLMYTGVLGVGAVGAVVARFRPAGMARAMVAVALVQVLIGAVGLIAGPVLAHDFAYEILGLTGLFAALWLVSAWLFRRADRERSGRGAVPAG